MIHVPFKNLALPFLVLLFIGVLGAQAVVPPWYLDLSAAFPASDFVAVAAEAPSPEEARSQALAQLAQYFGVQIRATSEASQTLERQVQAQEGQETLTLRIQSQVDLVSDQRLLAVRYTPVYLAGPQRHAVVAYIERSEGQAAWTQALDQTLEKLEHLVASAEDAALALRRRYMAAEAAAVVLDEAERLDAQRRLVAPGADHPLDLGSRKSRLESLSRGLEAQALFRVSLEGDDRGLVGEAVQEVITATGFALGEDGVFTVRARLRESRGPGPYGTKAGTWRLEVSLVEAGEVFFTGVYEGRGAGAHDAALDARLRDDLLQSLRGPFASDLLDAFTGTSHP